MRVFIWLARMVLLAAADGRMRERCEAESESQPFRRRALTNGEVGQFGAWSYGVSFRVAW